MPIKYNKNINKEQGVNKIKKIYFLSEKLRGSLYTNINIVRVSKTISSL